MGKAIAGNDRPGMSATIEYRRARRADLGRQRLSALLGLASAALLTAAGWLGRPWLAALACAAAVWARVMRPGADPYRWLRGAAGELATARLLATLPRRYIVLHDRRIPGRLANIDHVVIGPTGVTVVDSKAFRGSVRVRRGRVRAGRHEVAAGSVAWQAEQVARLLGIRVRAIVVVHGTGLRRRGKVVGGVPVVPAQRMCRRLQRGRRRLSRSEAARLAFDADRALPPAAAPVGRRLSP
jgi:hypothetical protein